MDLEQMLVKSKQPIPNLLICEFDNGFAIAYQKDEFESGHMPGALGYHKIKGGLRYELLPCEPCDSLYHERYFVEGTNVDGSKHGWDNGYIPRDSVKIMRRFRPKSYRQMAALNGQLGEVYDAIIKRLDVRIVKEKLDWENLSPLESELACLSLPKSISDEAFFNYDYVFKIDASLIKDKANGVMPAIDFRKIKERDDTPDILELCCAETVS